MSLARLLRSTLALSALLAALACPAAPVDEARAALGTGIDEVSAALRERPKQDDLIAQLDTLVEKHFAFTTTTRLAVGPAWRDFTPEQRKQVEHLFSKLVIRTYADRIAGDAAPDITYGAPTELKAGRVEVPTVIRIANNTYSIVYRLELDSGATPARWRVYDVVAEGVSLIANYRGQFEPILRKSGAEGLLETLSAKIAEPSAR
jgi:phospholipid transport system substrate-binding protein